MELYIYALMVSAVATVHWRDPVIGAYAFLVCCYLIWGSEFLSKDNKDDV